MRKGVIYQDLFSNIGLHVIVLTDVIDIPESINEFQDFMAEFEMRSR